ncbi:MAG: SDR family oxidoreductase [Myxococcota bacterium]
MPPPWTVEGKVCLITGANAGIGRATALELARQGARVAMVCRNAAKGEAARREIAAVASFPVDLFVADLARQGDVRRLAKEVLAAYETLSVVISNAGVVMNERVLTEEGHEATFAINHLAPFLLIDQLRDRIVNSAPARIIVVASQVEATGTIAFDDLMGARVYEPLVAYRQSKLANVLFTYELARRLRDTGVTVNCLHPGVIATQLLSDYTGRPRKLGSLHRLRHPGPIEGAQTSIHLAMAPALQATTGRYFRPDGEASSSPQSYDEGLAARLWAVSAELTGQCP